MGGTQTVSAVDPYIRMVMAAEIVEPQFAFSQKGTSHSHFNSDQFTLPRGDTEIFSSLKRKWVGEVTTSRRIGVFEGGISAGTKAGTSNRQGECVGYDGRRQEGKGRGSRFSHRRRRGGSKLPSGAGEGGVGIPVGATSQIQGKETV
jgi:hypothetical protein